MRKVKVTKELVHKIAGLANLPLTTDEEELYTSQLAEILDYVEQLSRVDTSNVEPTFNVTGLENVMREDKPSANQTLPQEEALQNAPEKDNGLFATKGIMKQE